MINGWCLREYKDGRKDAVRNRHEHSLHPRRSCSTKALAQISEIIHVQRPSSKSSGVDLRSARHVLNSSWPRSHRNHQEASRVLIEKYYLRLTFEFHTTKRITDEVALVPSKRLRNKISGFMTHLMKRVQRGPVRGISFKLQEEARELKDNYVPEVSALDTSATSLEVDPDTKALLESLNFDSNRVNSSPPCSPSASAASVANAGLSPALGGYELFARVGSLLPSHDLAKPTHGARG